MLMIVLARVAAADIAADPPTPLPDCWPGRCASGEVARECTTTLGELPTSCDWVDASWRRACMRKEGAQAVHVMCQPLDRPAPAPPPSPAESLQPPEAPSSPETGACG